MLGSIIKIVILAITQALIIYFCQKDNKERIKAEDNDNYSVYITKALTYVYLALAWMGLFLFGVFGFFYLLKNPSITMGNFIFTIVLVFIGVTVAWYGKKWLINVKGDHITFTRLFHKKREFTFQEIEKVETDNKGQIALYCRGKRVCVIGPFHIGSELLINSLKKYGKINDEHK